MWWGWGQSLRLRLSKSLPPFGFRLIFLLFQFFGCFWFWFTLLFCCIFFLHFSCCFAWYVATCTQISITPNVIIPSPPATLSHRTHLSHFPSYRRRPPTPTPEQTAVSDRRGAWEVPPTRQANSSYLTSQLAADRHGGSVQVYTPHLINHTPHPISMEPDLSHRS